MVSGDKKILLENRLILLIKVPLKYSFAYSKRHFLMNLYSEAK
jgi:hypothetical protein